MATSIVLQEHANNPAKNVPNPDLVVFRRKSIGVVCIITDAETEPRQQATGSSRRHKEISDEEQRENRLPLEFGHQRQKLKKTRDYHTIRLAQRCELKGCKIPQKTPRSSVSTARTACFVSPITTQARTQHHQAARGSIEATCWGYGWDLCT